MNKKVILVLVDGMRPESVAQCGHPFLSELAEKSASCMQSRTVMPSVTLPCHTSLFLSVDPERHGILTNDWRPQVRPIESLTERVHRFGGKTAMLYNWEPLRDLASPKTLDFSYMRRLPASDEGSMACDREVTDACVANLKTDDPDFTFLYLGSTDECGHRNGWMTPKYLEAVANASACIEKVYEAMGPGTTLIVTADHGGHGRGHGDDTDECMNIPIMFHGPDFEPGSKLTGVSIKDIAPTIAAVLGIPAPEDWEGRPVM